MSLLRLTFPTPHLDSTLKPIQRRIYRWGDMWGILMNDKWTVERRTMVESDPLLEKVERFPSVHTAPFKVDDVWDEEVYVREDGLEMNGLSSICLPSHALKQWSLKNNIPVSKSLESYTVSDPVVHVSPPKKPFNKSESYSRKYPQTNGGGNMNRTSRPYGSGPSRPKSSGFMIQD